jgi:hypothetical protein
MQAKISKSYARKVIIELENIGLLTDPEGTNLEKKRKKEKRYYLNPTEELLFLALRCSEKPGRPNHDYCTQLTLYYFISDTVYTSDEYNGMAAAFVSFCQMMVVQTCWLIHNEILVLDNVGIHNMGCKSADLEKFFWETIIDGHPLHVLVIYLPTRSP